MKANGIYLIEINGLKYIGKDTDIDKEKRKTEHLRLLKNNKHYNSYMQSVYNKYGDSFKYTVIKRYFPPISTKLLSNMEIHQIEKYKTYEHGLNLTRGGEGAMDYKHTQHQLKEKSIRVSGANNPMSKINKEDFLKIVDWFEEGLSNDEIALRTNLHPRYISLIRHKRRWKSYFEKYRPDYKICSRKYPTLTKEIVQNLYIDYHVNDVIIKDLMKKYNLARGKISNICRNCSYVSFTSEIRENLNDYRKCSDNINRE